MVNVEVDTTVVQKGTKMVAMLVLASVVSLAASRVVPLVGEKEPRWVDE
jgi:hypothetical protein